MSEALLWGPTCKALETRIDSGDALLLIVSPFIGIAALKQLIEYRSAAGNVKVIVRWRPEDIRLGVSDVEIFPYLAQRNIPLYMNDEIHLKLYVFESNIACITSANLTVRGFGYGDLKNVEVGTFAELTQGDWLRLHQLIERSRRVDYKIYESYKKYLESCSEIEYPPSPSFLSVVPAKKYLISSLPAVETAERFIECYLGAPFQSSDEIRRAAHDLAIFGIAAGLNKVELCEKLQRAFRSMPFVEDFVQLLRAEKSLRFGAVNDWIHDRCDDVPVPYKWEIKENTRIFYNWLEYFFKEIHWDRPNYSQVIYWNR